jgi:hypothetical protein
MDGLIPRRNGDSCEYGRAQRAEHAAGLDRPTEAKAQAQPPGPPAPSWPVTSEKYG